MTDLLVSDAAEAAAVETVGIATAVRRALPEIEARVRRRHPAASADVVQRSIDAAIQQFQDARVHTYLPILIERAASAALGDELHWAARDERPPSGEGQSWASGVPGQVVPGQT